MAHKSQFHPMSGTHESIIIRHQGEGRINMHHHREGRINMHTPTHTHTQIYTWIFMIHTCSITNYACICKQSAKWKAKSKVRRKINGSFY